jgi:hypothetical protein
MGGGCNAHGRQVKYLQSFVRKTRRKNITVELEGTRRKKVEY